MKSSHISKLLVCPKCRGALVNKDRFVECAKCESRYPLFQKLPILLTNFRKEDFIKTKKSFGNE